jgi:hypothetical protein
VQKHLNPDFPNYNLAIPDQYRLDIFLKDFEKYVKNGHLPNLIVMTLPTDHTTGGAAGYPTDVAEVADNDLAVGRLVDAVSHSPYWSSTALFFVEDDSQNGVDHVDGHRSIAFVASPYIRRHQVNHSYYTQLSMVRTIEDLLGLPPMNQHDGLAVPMTDAFTDGPDSTAFDVMPNQIPLDMLAPLAATRLQREWQTAVAPYFPPGRRQTADIADSNLLNHAIWYANHHFSKPFPAERRILHPRELKRTGTLPKRDPD